MTEPRTHPNGVVIPPDPGDPNHPDSLPVTADDLLGAWMPREGAWDSGRHDAEAFRQGQPPNVTYGWWCLTAGCDAEVNGLTREAAEAAAAAHAQNAPQKPHAPSSGPDRVRDEAL